MECEVTLQIGDKTEILTGADLDQYADSIGLSSIAKDRYSGALTADIYVHERFAGIEPWVIVQEVVALETGRSVRGTKPESPFKGELLRGLWHKHYTCARFVARNMINQLGRGKSNRIIAEVLNLESPTIITDVMINELARRLTVEQIEEREQFGELTGEWIVFAKHAGRNYYLCLATHNSGDKAIFDRIVSACLPQFPFLSEIVRLPAPDDQLPRP